MVISSPCLIRVKPKGKRQNDVGKVEGPLGGSVFIQRGVHTRTACRTPALRRPVFSCGFQRQPSAAEAMRVRVSTQPLPRVRSGTTRQSDVIGWWWVNDHPRHRACRPTAPRSGSVHMRLDFFSTSKPGVDDRPRLSPSSERIDVDVIQLHRQAGKT